MPARPRGPTIRGQPRSAAVRRSAEPSTLRLIESDDGDVPIDDTTDWALSGPEIDHDPVFGMTSRRGFFRTGELLAEPGDVGAGPRWGPEEADEQAHRFLTVLAGGREIRPFADPIEHARENSLLLLFGERELAAFTTLLDRMPRERADAWRELLGGGASSEAFGPLTLQERLDERQVEVALGQGRRQRVVSLVLGSAIAALVILAGVYLVRGVTAGEQRTEGALRFEDPVAADSSGAVPGGVPVASPELTTSLDIGVAVAVGEGHPDERLVIAPFADFPQPPGSLRASLFEYGGVGQIAVVGPAGWLNEPVCLRASVATADLRALDTTYFANRPDACVGPVGRPAVVACAGDSAVVIDLRIPRGGIELPEGGTGFADAVRVQLVASPDDRYDALSVRGLITVSADADADADVTIPRFGGQAGDTLTFELGADRTGTCAVTGDRPSA